MPTPTPPYTPLPTPVPSRADRTNFAARADAFLAALPDYQIELDAIADSAVANATSAEADASAADASRAAAEASQMAAAASAITAAQAAGAAVWASGSYASGAVVYSPSSALVYRRKAPGGSSPTDPANDATNWQLAIIAAPRYVIEAGAAVTAVVNTEHGLQNAGAVEVILPSVAGLAVGDTIWVSVENGRSDNYLTLTDGAKFNGEAQADDRLIMNDPYARLNLRWAGATYGWSC